MRRRGCFALDREGLCMCCRMRMRMRVDLLLGAVVSSPCFAYYIVLCCIVLFFGVWYNVVVIGGFVEVGFCLIAALSRGQVCAQRGNKE